MSTNIKAVRRKSKLDHVSTSAKPCPKAIGVAHECADADESSRSHVISLSIPKGGIIFGTPIGIGGNPKSSSDK